MVGCYWNECFKEYVNPQGFRKTWGNTYLQDTVFQFSQKMKRCGLNLAVQSDGRKLGTQYL